ncbi:MAG: response regulator [Anaerolineae bacterium]|nr:response regulator [Anaerolineae bacterium]
MHSIPRDLLADWSIVVIDDEEDSLEVANIILLEYGADVHIAYNGQQGLRIVEFIKPRFVISDLSMPTMDGWGVYQCLTS